MSFTRPLLLTLVATCLLLLIFTTRTTNAQNITGLTECVKYGNHIIQWTIDTRTDGTRYMRARYIKKGGYNGWAAIGFRYGYSWFYPVADPDNEQQPDKMGENPNPSTLYVVFRSPETDAHYFYEMRATSSDTPSSIPLADYVTKNVVVRSAVNGDIHLYFERDLVPKSAPINYFSFNASRTDANLMFATSDAATINNFGDFTVSSHNSAKILRYNLIAKDGADKNSVGSCSTAEMNAAVPAYRVPKVITQPSFGEDPQNNAPLSQSTVFLIAYLLGAVILGLFAYL